LVYIYKTKGTEKSFRNLIRAFGIDDELVKLNMYGNGIEYEVRNNRRTVLVAERFVDFNTEIGRQASVFQYQDSADAANTTGFIPPSTHLTGGYAQTLEADVLFPLKITKDSKFYYNTNVISSSLFGVHTTDQSQTNLAWASPDRTNFQVYAVRDELDSDNARFELTGTAGGFVPHLQSALFQDVYENTHWNLAVRIKPENYPRTYLSGADSGNYVVELHGVQVDAGVVRNEFTVSGSVTSPPAGFVTGSKRVFIGAHRTDFDGRVRQKSDIKVNACRYWLDYVDDEALLGHAYDTQNYGSTRPSSYAYPFEPNAPYGEILKSDTLVFNWEFAQNTGSNASGMFTVADEYAQPSGSDPTRFGALGEILNKQYTGRGQFFTPSSTKALDKDFVISSKLQLPENVQSSEMVQVLNVQEQNIFTKDSRPINYFFAFEKSMASAVSVEMINYFATLKDINNIIGDPVNRYRSEYKGLKILRQRFFERVSNSEIDFEKFYEFYKWFDTSLTMMLQQLVPASADFAENVRTIIESHMLERSKYQSKFQNVKKQPANPEGTAVGSEASGEMSTSPASDPQGVGFYSMNAFSRRQIGSSQPINFKWWQYTHAPTPRALAPQQRSLEFNGDNTYVQISEDATSSEWEALIGGAAATAKPYSYSLWWYATEMGGSVDEYVRLISFGNDSRAIWFTGATLGSAMLVAANAAGNNKAYTASGVISAGSWYHIVVTFTGGGAGDGLTNIYINGADATDSLNNSAEPAAIGVSISKIGAGGAGLTRNAPGHFADVAVWNKGLSQEDVAAIYAGGNRIDLLSLGAVKDNLISWWELGGDSRDTYDGTIYDQTGFRNGTPVNFPSDALDNTESPPIRLPYSGPSLTQNNIWWTSRAERGNEVISGSSAALNKNKQTVLMSNQFKDFRSQQAPYRFGGSGTSTLGGVGFNTNKKINFVFTATTPFGSMRDGAPENVIAGMGSEVEQLINTTDVYHPAYKQRLGFGMDPDINRDNGSPIKGDGNLFLPFSLYSSSVTTGYNHTVVEDYAPNVQITNLHHDLVDSSDIPAQGPFTEKFVGGRTYRHAEINDGNDTGLNRAEGFKLEILGQELSIIPPNYADNDVGYNADTPTGQHLRNVGAKRPVNIQNIMMTTASVGTRLEGVERHSAIGNYQKNYQVVMSNSRRKNDPFFNDQSFNFALHPETMATRGRFPLSTGSTANPGGNLDYELPSRIGSASNQSIVVNRFAGSGYEVMSRGYMDPAHEEMSVYNALPYHNLSVINYGLSGSASVDPSIIDTLRVQDQLGKVRGLNQRFDLHCGPFGSDAAYGSVPTLTYVTTPSYHKVNRNAKRQLQWSKVNYAGEFNGTTSEVNIGTSTVWDALIGGTNDDALPFTISAWVRPRSVDNNAAPRIVDMGSAGRRTIYLYTSANVRFEIEGTQDGKVRTDHQTKTNEWMHVVVTYAGGDPGGANTADYMKIYINGELDTVVDQQLNGPDVLTNDSIIGNSSTAVNREFDGFIQGVGIWGRDLTPAEIINLYGRGENLVDPTLTRRPDETCAVTSALPNDLLAWYAFDSALGDTASDVENRAPAASPGTDGAGADLTIQSAVAIKSVSNTYKKVYDNWYVQHPIPQSEQQYAWMTASLMANKSILGLDSPSCYSSTALCKLMTGSSDPYYGNISFLGLNGPTTDPVNTTTHTLGQLDPNIYTCPPPWSAAASHDLNQHAWLNIGSKSTWDALIGLAGASARAFTIAMWIQPKHLIRNQFSTIQNALFYFGGSPGDADGGCRRAFYQRSTTVTSGPGVQGTFFFQIKGATGSGPGNGLVEVDGTLIPDGIWTHVAVTFEGGSTGAIRVYVNGALVDSNTTDNPKSMIDSQASDAYIGYIGTNLNATTPTTWDSWKGGMSNVTIWGSGPGGDGELTNAQVAEVYNGGSAAFDPIISMSDSLIAWYRFNPLHGDTNPVFNSTENAYRGTIVNQVGVNNTEGMTSRHVTLQPSSTSEPKMLNFLTLSRNGPYGYPTWKQIRTGETKVARALRKKNIIGIADPPPYLEQKNAEGQFIGFDRGLSSNSFTNYVEQPIASSAKPIFFAFEDNDADPDVSNNLALDVSYQNNLDYFSHTGLNNKLNLVKIADEGNAYNTVADFAINSNLSFMVKYGQTIYPKETNMYQNRVRSRETYGIVDIWNACSTTRWSGIDLTCNSSLVTFAEGAWLHGYKNNSDIRTILNSQNLPVTGASIWPLDYEYSASVSGSGDFSPTNGITYGWFPWRNNPSGSLQINRDGQGGDHVGKGDVGDLGFLTDIYDGKGIAAPSGELMNTYSRFNFPGLAINVISSDGAGTGNRPVFTGRWGARQVEWLIRDSDDRHGYIKRAASAKAASTYTMPIFGGNRPLYGNLREMLLDATMPANPEFAGNRTSGLMSGAAIVAIGETPWTAPAGSMESHFDFPKPIITNQSTYWGDQPGPQPYQTYQELSSDFRLVGKDYTVVPEFRISQHLADWVDTHNANFLDSPPALFEVPGGSLESVGRGGPGQAGTVTSAEFYKVYSTTDFMKYFKVVDEDFAGQTNAAGVNVDRHALELSCEAILQFLPYEGFYPAERTLELGTLLSHSLGEIDIATNAIKNSGSIVQPGAGAILKRIIYEPLISPGILYNTIKSGIAVDNFVIGNMIQTYRAGSSSPDGFYKRPIDGHALVSKYPLYENLLRESGSVSASVDQDRGGPNWIYNISAGYYGDNRAATWPDMINYDYGGFRLRDTWPGKACPAGMDGGYTGSGQPPVNDDNAGVGGTPHWMGTNITAGSYGFPLLNLTTEKAVSDWVTSIAGSGSLPPNINDMSSRHLNTGGYFLKKLPFEALRDPEKYLGSTSITEEWLYDTGLGMASLHHVGSALAPLIPSLSSSMGDIRSKIKYSGVSKSPLYKMAIDNFLCETYNFFLKGPQNCAFLSKQEEEFMAVTSGSYYGMSVDLSVPNTWGWETMGDLDGARGKDPTRTFGMYSRASAFGPPIALCGLSPARNATTGKIKDFILPGGAGTPGGEDATYQTSPIWSYEHVLPPYFYGSARANILYKAEFDGRVTLNDIMGGAVVEYAKDSFYSSQARAQEVATYLNDPLYGDFTTLASASCRQGITGGYDADDISAVLSYSGLRSQISSSVNIFDKLMVIPEGTAQQESRWLIQPKFETPVLNFYNTEANRIGVGSGSAGGATKFINPGPTTYVDRGDLTGSNNPYLEVRGMWHQYGNPVIGESGLNLAINDMPKLFVSGRYGEIPVKSLRNVVGFETNSKRVGDFADARKLEEAVVIVPFINVRGDRRFFDIEPSSPTYIRQLALLNKYLFPPTFDYLTNPTVKPIVFYAFEFEMTLDQEDLMNIWQNVPPKSYSGRQFQKTNVQIKIKDLVDRLMENNEELEWMVFKVKRKAEKDYNVYTKKVLTEEKPIVQPALSLPYSYNWPYDYFSIVELVKIDAEMTYATEDIITDAEEEVLVAPDLEEFIPMEEDVAKRLLPTEVQPTRQRFKPEVIDRRKKRRPKIRTARDGVEIETGSRRKLKDRKKQTSRRQSIKRRK